MATNKICDRMLLSACRQNGFCAMVVFCSTNTFISFDLFMVYIPECKQQLRTVKEIRDTAHFNSGL